MQLTLSSEQCHRHAASELLNWHSPVNNLFIHPFNTGQNKTQLKNDLQSRIKGQNMLREARGDRRVDVALFVALAIAVYHFNFKLTWTYT